MKNKINSISALLTAFESRNEQLHDEIKKNEEAIEEMKAELAGLLESETEQNLIDSKIEMVA
ncbi:MAG: hypothetical protein HFI73_05665 [Bacilli bacterium]|jgi:predicted RNase H-like nuclease (RuvC/YqgF family)|nr:hypothetical protein [Bacilli bacterium]